MTPMELAAYLSDAAERVATGDSLQGRIIWDAMDDAAEPGMFVAEVRYRMGNSYGQGGMRLLLPDDATEMGRELDFGRQLVAFWVASGRPPLPGVPA